MMLHQKVVIPPPPAVLKQHYSIVVLVNALTLIVYFNLGQLDGLTVDIVLVVPFLSV